MHFYFLVALGLTVPALWQAAHLSGRSKVDLNAEDFSIIWTLLYGRDGEQGFRYGVTIENNGNVPLPGRGWTLYFNFGYGIVTESASANVMVTNVNGDFYEMTPTDLFGSVKPGDGAVITFESRSLAFKKSASGTGFYFVFGGEPGPPQSVTDVRIEPEITPEQTVRAEMDQVAVPTAASIYRENENLTLLLPEAITPILPTPVRYKEGVGDWVLDATAVIQYQGSLAPEATFLTNALEEQSGIRIKIAKAAGPASKAISLGLSDVVVAGRARHRGDEAYRLSVSAEHGVEITGSDRAGLFYGIQSFLALLPINPASRNYEAVDIPEIVVEDGPRFLYRGFMLDVARNFQTRETVLKLLDLMAFYKLNKFHFHLADDEGWRLEITSLPELTEVGSRRGHTLDERDRLIPSFGSGPEPGESRQYYTRSDFIEILRLAHARHIEVIPEIDLPGHARAAIKSMEARYFRLMEAGQEEEAQAHRLVDAQDQSVYRSVQGWNDNVVNVCQPSTYRFIETIVDEIIEMYAEADVPLNMIHVGGDEVPKGVWTKSPACEALLASQPEMSDAEDLSQYFRHRIIEIFRARGLLAAGWQEMALQEHVENDTTQVEPNRDWSEAMVSYYWHNVWGWGAEDIGYQLANAGFRVVLSCATNLYFDLAYDKDPKEPGLTWAGFVDTRTAFEFTPIDIFKSAKQDRMGNPIDRALFQIKSRLTAEGEKNILGMQGQLWGERLTHPDRLEYMAFPKLLGLAERAWAEQSAWERIEEPQRREEGLAKDWNRFANALGQRELPRLDGFRGGVAYRIPTPGAVVENDTLKANVQFPGMTIRYTMDGKEPTPDSRTYTAPLVVHDVIKLRTFDARGRGGRTVTVSN